jgi:hypothetical protein
MSDNTGPSAAAPRRSARHQTAPRTRRLAWGSEKHHRMNSAAEGEAARHPSPNFAGPIAPSTSPNCGCVLGCPSSKRKSRAISMMVDQIPKFSPKGARARRLALGARSQCLLCAGTRGKVETKMITPAVRRACIGSTVVARGRA